MHKGDWVMSCFKLKDGRWVVQRKVWEDGRKKQIREYFGRGDEGEKKARARARELLNQRNAIEELKKRKLLRKAMPTVAEVVGAYTKSKFTHVGMSATDQYNCFIRLEKRLMPFFGDEKCLELDFDKMDAYVKMRSNEWADRKQTRKVKSVTIKRELSIIMAALNWAADKDRHLLPYNPIEDYKLPGNDSDAIRALSDEESNRIFKKAPAHLKRAIVLGTLSGVRIGKSELLKIDWQHVDLKKNIIFVISAKKHGPEKRQVHICEQLREFMARWCEEDMQMQKVDHPGLLFGPIVHYKGRRIGSFKKAWKTALRKAGIRRRIRPYDLRHTFVTNLLENGAELKTVSEIVGHTRPDTTLRLYHHVSPGKHKEAIKLVPRLYATDEPDRSTEQAEGKEGQKKGQHKNDS